MEQLTGYYGLTVQQIGEWTKDGMMSVRPFEKKQILMNLDDEGDLMGVILHGTACLENINLDAQRRILDYYGTEDMFCRSFFPDTERSTCCVVSKSKGKAAFFHFRRLMLLADGDGAAGKLLDRLLTISGKRAMIHTDVLGQRTLRNKLLAYFEYLAVRRHSLSFSLPLSLTDCADYLAVDRSAMMRELCKMREEGIVRAKGRQIELLKKVSVWGESD